MIIDAVIARTASAARRDAAIQPSRLTGLDRHASLAMTGYDKRTGRLVYESGVPAELWTTVRGLANVAPDDQDAVGSYPLNGVAAGVVAQKLNLTMRLDSCDWFLEPFGVG